MAVCITGDMRCLSRQILSDGFLTHWHVTMWLFPSPECKSTKRSLLRGAAAAWLHVCTLVFRLRWMESTRRHPCFWVTAQCLVSKSATSWRSEEWIKLLVSKGRPQVVVQKKKDLKLTGCQNGRGPQIHTFIIPLVEKYVVLNWLWISFFILIFKVLLPDHELVYVGNLWKSQSLGEGAAEASKSQHSHRPGGEQGRPGREETSGARGESSDSCWVLIRFGLVNLHTRFHYPC